CNSPSLSSPEDKWLFMFFATNRISHSLSVGGSLMHSLGRLLDSSLVWYNTNSNRGQNMTTRPRSDDSNSRNGRCRHRQINQSLNTSGVDIENIREQILRQIFDLLSNLAWSSEALGFFAKDPASLPKQTFLYHILFWLPFPDTQIIKTSHPHLVAPLMPPFHTIIIYWSKPLDLTA
ncbi:hypothetical protein ACTXT7_009313, partial [Hymenolepis weldensis]